MLAPNAGRANAEDDLGNLRFKGAGMVALAALVGMIRERP